MKIDPEKLKTKPKRGEEEGDEEPQEPKPIAQSIGNRAIDLAYNPEWEALRSVTVIDYMQGRLFPIIDMILSGQQYLMEVVTYRNSREDYYRLYRKGKPKTPPQMPALLEELLKRTAQWQKSVKGTALDKLTLLAQTEIEAQAGKDELSAAEDIWKADE